MKFSLNLPAAAQCRKTKQVGELLLEEEAEDFNKEAGKAGTGEEGWQINRAH
jgi:hypothetical protein